MFQPKRLDYVGRRADEANAIIAEPSCKFGVFRQKAISRDDSVCLVFLRNRNNLITSFIVRISHGVGDQDVDIEKLTCRDRQ